jgi:hypothetical protein
MAGMFPLQETTPTDWSGLTTVNHLYSIYGMEPQKASNLITMIRQANYGLDFNNFLETQFGVEYYDSDADFRWMLQGHSRKNIPLIRAEINGTTVTGADKTGINMSHFTLVFGENYFSETDLIVGEKNERYPIRIVEEPTFVGNEVHYNCELFTGDDDLFIPFEELQESKRFSKEWNPVETYLSTKGGTVNYTSPFSMINRFSSIRMEDTRPGNFAAKPVSFTWMTGDGPKTTWLQYADWEFDTQFQDSLSYLLMFATSNQTEEKTFRQKGKSGVQIVQGAGVKQQIDSSNVAYYNSFTVQYITQFMLEMSINRLSKDQRKFMFRTGEWGMYQFSESIEDYTQLYTPNQTESRIYMGSGNSMGYRGQFLEYKGPNGLEVSVMHEPLNDDLVRNKIMHSEGGVAESRVYYILDIGTSNGNRNIQKCSVRNSTTRAVVPGIRCNPMAPSLQGGWQMAANPVDGWYITIMEQGIGSRVTDPSRTGIMYPAVLADVGVTY